MNQTIEQKRRFSCRVLSGSRAVVSFLVLFFVCTITQAQRAHTLTGDIRVHQNFHSQILGNDRTLLVYLPPGYAANKHGRYPVFYLNDGQNLFDGATSFIPGQEWQVDETAQSLISRGRIEPLIIVGIYNAGDARINEYTPTRDRGLKLGGNADAYGRMVVEEIKPFIDRQYRTNRESKQTAIGGSSLGALVSLYLALKYPQVFGEVAVVSPSVWFADKQIINFVKSVPRKPRLRIWLDTGTNEGGNKEEALSTVMNARLLKDTLVLKGWKPGVDLSYYEAEGAQHNERAWAVRLPNILEFLFPRH